VTTGRSAGVSNYVDVGFNELVEMGFTPLEAIQSATIRNAEMLRLEKSIGVIETGYEADLITVEKNPLETIATVQDPLLVISNGRVGLDRLNFAR